jgi:glycosyltransferase involved in cell wall biosynthesis
MTKARLLDLTRLVSRLGQRPLTGIDRVELAYLDAFIAEKPQMFGLVRTSLGFLLLDQAGGVKLAEFIRSGQRLVAPQVWQKILRRGPTDRKAAEAFARKNSIASSPAVFLGQMLRKVLPSETDYFNVGHANLSANVFIAVRSIRNSRAYAMVHDTSPLDYPQYCREDMIKPFEKKIKTVSEHADFVIHLTLDQRRKTESHFSEFGRIPEGIIAGLGLTPALLPAENLAQIKPRSPYFVMLGTIEPRKNHALILDVWKQLVQKGGDVPHLYICGKRGWADPSVFAQIDALALQGFVTPRTDLDDASTSFLLRGASALLFPTYAEGYGLPPLEALALATPVICSDLPVIREVLGEFAVYLSPTDSYSWLETITRFLASPSLKQKQRFEPPTWRNHFLKVLGEGFQQ